tara:strand:+ start:299 stop:1327 length:1029 start_codon:yes stop_codon:yes gene_type:complete
MFKCIIIIILLVFLYTLNRINNYSEYFSIPTGHERPFVNVFDNNNNQIKIILLSHPFTRDSSYEQYKKYKKDKFIILGIASYNEFPKITTNKLDTLSNPTEKAWTYDYMKVVDGWLHCFRNPDKYIDKNIPRTLISESDFTDYNTFKPDESVKKEYDYIYVCPKDSDGNCNGWAAENKNWKLGLKCIKILSGKLKLKGLLVGRKGCPLPKKCEKFLETTDFLSQSELINSYRKSKFILVPNRTDASPRVLTEALCTDTPALLNYNIVGGWKYINKKNGALFKTLDDLEKGANFIIKNIKQLKPRKEYLEKYGKQNAGKKLKEFLNEHYKDKIDVSGYEYLTL